MIERALRLVARALPANAVQAIGRWQFSGPGLRRRLALAAARRLARHPARVGRGPGRGLLVDPGGMNPGYVLGTTEPQIQEAVIRHLRPGGVFYDVGAGAGFYSLLAARLVGVGGAVYAFEPVPANADLVERNALANGFPQVRVFGAAIAGASGSGYLLIDVVANHSRLVDGPGEGVVEVEIVSIDDLLAQGALRPPGFVKIDVEGAELDVLRGTRETIAAYRPVVLVELHWVGPSFLELAADVLPGYELEPLSGDPSFRLEDVAFGHVLALPSSAAA